MTSHGPALVAIGGGHPSKLRACKIIEGSWHVPFSPGNNFKPDFYGDLDPLGCQWSHSPLPALDFQGMWQSSGVLLQEGGQW